MDWLLNLIPGGGITALVASVLAALIAIVAVLRGAKHAGIDEQKAKEAEVRAKNLEDVRRARDAADAVKPSDSLHDDPHNRDVRR